MTVQGAVSPQGSRGRFHTAAPPATARRLSTPSGMTSMGLKKFQNSSSKRQPEKPSQKRERGFHRAEGKGRSKHHTPPPTPIKRTPMSAQPASNRRKSMAELTILV